MRSQVLQLYKDLMRYGQKLQFTDKSYFRFKVRKDFYDNLNLDSPKDIKFHLEKGQQLLLNQRVV